MLSKTYLLTIFVILLSSILVICSQLTVYDFYDGSSVDPLTTDTFTNPTETNENSTTQNMTDSTTHQTGPSYQTEPSSEISNESTSISSTGDATNETSDPIGYTDTKAPLIIQSPETSDISENSVIISWVTNESAQGWVEYGTTSNFATGSASTTDKSESLLTHHSMELTGLTENTTYYYRVFSSDSSENLGESNEYSFTTHNPDMITSLDETKLFHGDTLIINGTFPATQPTNGWVEFTSIVDTPTLGTVTSWTDTEIQATVPSDAGSGDIRVFDGLTYSNPEEISVWKRTRAIDGGSNYYYNQRLKIALDSNDIPFISYHGDDAWQYDYIYLSYFNTIDQIWRTNHPEGSQTHRPDNFTSVALDSSDYIHVLYDNRSNDTLRYAFYNGATWDVVAVDTTGSVGKWGSLVLDNTDIPHAAYYRYDGGNEALRYAYKSASSWITEDIDTSIGTNFPSVGGTCALVYTTGIHVAYYGGNQLRWGTRIGTGTWQVQVIDSTPETGKYVSSACSTSTCYVAYYLDGGAGVGSLQLASRGTGGGTWSAMTLDDSTSADVGQYCSMAVDSLGNPHIVYFDAINSELRYHYKDGSVWINEKVSESGPTPNGYCSIAMDSNDYAKIVFGSTDLDSYLEEKI